MKRTPLQLNLNEWPEELADYLKDAKIYDSSCSPEARVVYIDKDEGFYLKKAAEGALKTEARIQTDLKIQTETERGNDLSFPR